MLPTDRDLTTDDSTTATRANSVTTNTTATTVTCPECGNDKICRARRKGFDRIISLVNIYPYCCRTHTCQARFYRFGRRKN